MTPERQRLKTSLVELQRRLAELQDVDPTVRQQLHDTIAEIEALLDEPKPPSDPGEGSLAERLSEAVSHFEESHPTFAGLLGSIIDALGRMGI